MMRVIRATDVPTNMPWIPPVPPRLEEAFKRRRRRIILQEEIRTRTAERMQEFCFHGMILLSVSLPIELVQLAYLVRAPPLRRTRSGLYLTLAISKLLVTLMVRVI